MTAARTAEAYVWTRDGGLQHGGFASESAIVPSQNLRSPKDTVYDVIVVGGGYAGLAAARDLTTAGRSVLLIEGRDRIGGRSYTIEHEGFKIEMGGTWIYHTQPYTYRELMRYHMDKDIVSSRDHSRKNNYYSFNVPASKRDLSHEDAVKVIGKVWKLFVNIDGVEGKKVCPLPYAQTGNAWVDLAEVKRIDGYSCLDRFNEIKDQLNEEEQGVLQAMIVNITGGKPDMKNSGYWDMIRSHALNGHSYEQMDEIWINYKMRDGSSHLSRQIFDEAVDYGLEYTLNTHVEKISQKDCSSPTSPVSISSRDGRVFQGRKVVCTAPLNTLKSIQFEPAFDTARQEVIAAGHINFMTKAHAFTKGPDMASWAGACYPGALNMCFGDGVTAEGNAHLTAFGCDFRDHFVLEEHPEKIHDAFQDLHPMEIEKIAFHNWNTDPYTQGGPCFYPPGFVTTYIEELRKRHGNVFFANADWAHAWRNFIDGALEQGALSGFEILKELRLEDKAGNKAA